MARLTDQGVYPLALIAARGGMTATALNRQLRQLGIGARESEVRALFKIAQETIKNSPDEPFADPNEVPDLATAKPWRTITATGVKQAVEITYRVKAVGTLVTVPYMMSSENGVTRAEAIQAAINAYASQAESYDQELVGAVHTKTLVLTPAIRQ